MFYLNFGLIILAIAGLIILILLFPPRWLIAFLFPLICPGAVFAADTQNKVVALTIDDGPGLENSTQEILEVLTKNNAQATFFLISSNAEKNPQAVTAIIEKGHEIGNHMTEDEKTIALTQQAFQENLSQAHEILFNFAQQSIYYPRITWFRPGGGWGNAAMVNFAAKNYGYCTALGNIWPYDTFWGSSTQFSRFFILSNIRPGSIIILHDGGNCSKRGKQTVETLKLVLPELQKKGYQIVTLSTLYDK